jgi:hypothetical protein
MKSSCIKLVALLAILLTGLFVQAQTPNAPEAQKGFTEIETFQGTVNSTDKLIKLDSTLGYDFNKHFGIFAGLPIYISNFSSTTTSTTTTTTGTTSTSGTHSGIGNFYMGLAFRAPNPTLNYASTITVGAPTGSTSNGFSTGRASLDWSNYFDHSFNRFTPFFSAGIGNGVPDSALVTHAFTSLGAVGHFEEGAEYELVHHFAAGGSAYQDTPFGNQKVFSKLVKEGQTSGGSGTGRSHGGAFETSFFSSGNDLTRENGVNAWVAFQPTQFWRAQLGYSRSVTFDLNSFSFNLGVNVGKLLHAHKNQ